MRLILLSLSSVFALQGLACAATLSDAEKVQIVQKVCPSAHEIEEIDPLRMQTPKGKVVVKEPNGSPQGLPDAVVHLTRMGGRRDESGHYSSRTAQDGSFAVDAAPDGRYRLTVCKEGFVTLDSTVALSRKANQRSVVLSTRLDW